MLACREQPNATRRKEAISTSPVSAPEPTKAADSQRGAHWVRHFECARCHQGTGQPKPELSKRCVGCHRAILAGDFPAPAPVIRHWQDRIRHLVVVPGLSHVGSLYSTDWLVQFLQEPHDLRPSLAATMPRLPVRPDQAEDIAAYFRSISAVPAPQQPQPSAELATDSATELGEGRRLFTSKGCDNCHAFEKPVRLAASKPGASDSFKRSGPPEALLLAPDLRHVRRRFLPSALVPWLMDPLRFKEDARMPDLKLTLDEATALARFIWKAPLSAASPLPEVERLPVLHRRVSFDEVQEKVFRAVCWHCHAEPDLARGDGGPGMSGGFGFAPRQLDLSSFGAMLDGYLGKDGSPQILTQQSGSNEPVLLQVLLNRQLEERGRTGVLRGMPLGLPSLSAEQIQLVESWLVQGRPE